MMFWVPINSACCPSFLLNSKSPRSFHMGLDSGPELVFVKVRSLSWESSAEGNWYLMARQKKHKQFHFSSPLPTYNINSSCQDFSSLTVAKILIGTRKSTLWAGMISGVKSVITRAAKCYFQSVGMRSGLCFREYLWNTTHFHNLLSLASKCVIGQQLTPCWAELPLRAHDDRGQKFCLCQRPWRLECLLPITFQGNLGQSGGPYHVSHSLPLPHSPALP